MAEDRIIIAAPSSGQGKTTATMGILAALKQKGLIVQPYKVGPDYIDPAFHTMITGRSSINIDSWLLDGDYIKMMLKTYSDGADISIIEGVMGLYDGFGSDILDGSTAGISKLLKCPVILVMECDGMAASAAAVVHGFKSLGNADIRGVIINKPSSIYHYNLVKASIETYTDVKVLGYIPKTHDIELKSRHLGLVQSSEIENLQDIIYKLADIIESYIDINKLIDISKASDSIDALPMQKTAKNKEIKIAVALDKAFSFYYNENFEILKRLGAELAFFSPMLDRAIPSDCHGIYIGGGYPEIFAKELSDNISLRKDIASKAEAGMPIFAECGGFMYLNKSFLDKAGQNYEFVGIFDGEASMTEKLQNFGYAEITALEDNCIMKKGDKVKVHEFHKSKIIRQNEAYSIAVSKTRDGHEVKWSCGMKRWNTFGMYPHIYFPANMKLPENFINSCLKYKRKASSC